MSEETKTHAETVSDAADKARGWGVCHACKVRRPMSAFDVLDEGTKLKCTDGCTQEPPRTGVVDSPIPTTADVPRWAKPNPTPAEFDNAAWNKELQNQLEKAGALRDTGIKYDGGKSRLDLVPMRALLEVGHVLAAGAERYGPNNWRKVVGWKWRYTGAALRHVAAYLMGKRTDDEGKHTTRRHHLACALCSLLFVLENELAKEEGVKVPDGDARSAADIIDSLKQRERG